AATGIGESAGLVDLGDHLDPVAAAAMGVDLDRLLWVRPESVRHALAAAEMLVGSGFPLVVVELGSPPLAGSRGAESFWLRLARGRARPSSSPPPAGWGGRGPPPPSGRPGAAPPGAAKRMGRASSGGSPAASTSRNAASPARGPPLRTPRPSRSPPLPCRRRG